MNDKVIEGLDICYKTANILKDSYPNEIMKIKPNDTILEFSKKNSRKTRAKSMGSWYAFYHNETHRIIIKQKSLSQRLILRTKVKNQSDRVLLSGNWALIELMSHELAHHRTKGHAKGFKIKYNKLVNRMAQSVFSGEFYQNTPPFDMIKACERCKTKFNVLTTKRKYCNACRLYKKREESKLYQRKNRKNYKYRIYQSVYQFKYYRKSRDRFILS